MIGDSPVKGSDKYIWAGLSSATKPSNAFIGSKVIETDTGLVYEWDGSNWCQRIDGVQIEPLVKSIPTTSTFHHLGHEGKVFLHSDEHSGIANGANFDTLIIIPAGGAVRQVHMRFAYSLSGATPGTDVQANLILYKDTLVSANGSSEAIVSNNDAIVKTSGVTIFTAPTIDTEPADLGTVKAQTLITSARRTGGSQDQIVPEWILAPNGASARNYLLRLTNNSGGAITAVNAIFFYDTGAA